MWFDQRIRELQFLQRFEGALRHDQSSIRCCTEVIMSGFANRLKPCELWNEPSRLKLIEGFGLRHLDVCEASACRTEVKELVLGSPGHDEAGEALKENITKPSLKLVVQATDYRRMGRGIHLSSVT